MIISDAKRLAFVHIPKCGGTSLRRSLSNLEGARHFERPGVHEEFGHIDFAHMNMTLLFLAFPEEFEKVRQYESYCLVRNPRIRFRSSLDQRLKMHLNTSIGKLSDRELRSELDIVINHLSLGRNWQPAEFVHFETQVSFIFLNKVQIVKNAFCLHQIDDMIAAMVGAVQSSDQFLPIGVSISERSALKLFVRLVGSRNYGRLTSLLGSNLKRQLRQYTHTSPANQIFPSLNSSYVTDFIATYYADDIRLWDQIKLESSNNADSGD